MNFRGGDDDVDGFDTHHERNDNSAQAIDKQVALQNGQRADRLELHAAQGERNQRDDDQRVEDDGAEMALLGLCKRMIFSGAMAGKVTINMAGMIAKYLATSLAMLNVVNEPRVMSQLLADFDDLDELGRIGVEVDHFCRPPSRPASRCSWPRRHRHTGQRRGIAFVPSPIIATMRPPDCSLRIFAPACPPVWPRRGNRHRLQRRLPWQ